MVPPPEVEAVPQVHREGEGGVQKAPELIVVVI